MVKRLWTLLTLVLLAGLVLSACAAPAAAPAAAPGEAAGGEAAAPAEEVDFITWYQYDEKNEDPASDERVGNQYLRDTIPVFNEAFDGKWNWVNQPKAWDKMMTELVAAVQAGGDVPDLYEMGSGSVTLFYQNGVMQDLTEWASAQPWFAEMDQSSLEACTGPDGGLYCLPVAQRPHLVYVWKDRFPNGYPTTPEEFLTEAERLKAEGLYAVTFFGSTDFNGAAISRGMWTTIASFGGKLDDGQGNMTLNTPENVAAVEFLRTIVQNGYVPEIAFAGGFQEENAFKDASAGSFPTGLFGYRYVNPLSAPSGTEYAKGNEEDMLDAIAAGDVLLSPFIAAEGKMPGCGVEVAGFGIPVGAKNPDAAKDYINWLMTDPAQNADWVLRPGGGFPALKSTQSAEQFQTPFYKEAADVLSRSQCHPWYGSLDRTEEAAKLAVGAIYKLIKEDPTLDIAAELQRASDEYNAGN
jgi:multiple sugar transport system substrate-binding protein